MYCPRQQQQQKVNSLDTLSEKNCWGPGVEGAGDWRPWDMWLDVLSAKLQHHILH